MLTVLRCSSRSDPVLIGNPYSNGARLEELLIVREENLTLQSVDVVQGFLPIWDWCRSSRPCKQLWLSQPNL